MLELEGGNTRLRHNLPHPLLHNRPPDIHSRPPPGTYRPPPKGIPVRSLDLHMEIGTAYDFMISLMILFVLWGSRTQLESCVI